MVATLKMELPIGKSILKSLEPRMLSPLELREDVREISGRRFDDRLFGMVVTLWTWEDYVRMIPEVQEYDVWDPPAEYGIHPLLPRCGRPRKYDIEHAILTGEDTGERRASRGPRNVRYEKRSLPSIQESIHDVLKSAPMPRGDLSYMVHELSFKDYNDEAFKSTLNYDILKGKVRFDPVSRLYCNVD